MERRPGHAIGRAVALYLLLNLAVQTESNWPYPSRSSRRRSTRSEWKLLPNHYAVGFSQNARTNSYNRNRYNSQSYRNNKNNGNNPAGSGNSDEQLEFADYEIDWNQITDKYWAHRLNRIDRNRGRLNSNSGNRYASQHNKYRNRVSSVSKSNTASTDNARKFDDEQNNYRNSKFSNNNQHNSNRNYNSNSGNQNNNRNRISSLFESSTAANQQGFRSFNKTATRYPAPSRPGNSGSGRGRTNTGSFSTYERPEYKGMPHSIWPGRYNLDRHKQVNRGLLKAELEAERARLPETPLSRRSWFPTVTVKNYDPFKVKQSPRGPDGRPIRRIPFDKQIQMASQRRHSLPNDCGSFRGNPDFNVDILNAHNGFRWKHGSPMLSWNVQLANLATDWARTLAAMNNGFDHRPNTPYGENIWMVRDIAVDLSLKYKFSQKAVEHWYIEKHQFDWQDAEITSDNGHFTQVVWKNSLELGCGYAADVECYRIYVVCNYSPIGNHYDKRIIQKNVQPVVQGRA